MMAIDAEHLKKWILARWLDNGGKDNDAPTAEEILDQIDREIRYASFILAVPQWVAVAEKLPEEKGEYLVTYHPSYWDEVSAETKVGIDSFRGKSSWAKKKYQRVTAWAVLPEPYEGGDRGKVLPQL